MPYELRIALRYLTARRKQAFISLISVISIMGVAVGVMALLIALGLMTGLQGEIQRQILGATAHVFVFRSQGDPIADYRQATNAARAQPGVSGAAPVVYSKGLLVSSTGSAFVTVKGVLPEFERTVTELGSQVTEGSLAALDAASSELPPVLLGRDLARTLAVGVGDVVAVIVPEGKLSPLGMLPARTRLRVAGLVRSGLYEFDAQWAYVSLATSQRLFLNGADSASQIEVKLRDIYGTRAAAERIVAVLGDGYLTHDWIHLYGNLFTALWLEKVAIGITIGLIVMVAALNIISTLILLVMEKHKDIAILVSMGASRSGIMRIFMLEGTIIGTIGTVLGTFFGTLTCRVLDHYRLIRVPADVYQVSYVPFRLLPGEALLVVLGALVVCFVATIYPARGAARLDPAEALRYE
jgi:lipoprotein-releasing system permease protein